jgi:hypothetical protein
VEDRVDGRLYVHQEVHTKIQSCKGKREINLIPYQTEEKKIF